MKNMLLKPEKTIGLLLVISSILLFVPYIVLSITFDYPQILRQDIGFILQRFEEGGSSLIWTWWAFAMVGLPLIPAYILLGQQLESQLPSVRWITFIGVTGLVVQMLGLLRWTFVVPILAVHYVHGDEMSRAATEITFRVLHQYGGVVLGEHIGQLFTIIWTLGISYTVHRQEGFSHWLSWFGYATSLLYLLAQTELFATVMPELPIVDWAGLVGSTLWLVWLIALGLSLWKRA